MKNRRDLVFVILIALTVRSVLLFGNYLRHPEFFERRAEKIASQISAADLPYMDVFGFEVGNLAYSIVCKKQGFASPFGGDTGPSAWVAPGGVMIYCLAFSLFGCFSTGALLFLFGIAMLLSVLIIILVYNLSLQLFGNRTAALLSALVFALSLQDAELFNKAHQQDFNIYSFFFILVFYLFIQYMRNRSRKRLILFSIVAGVSLLFIPVLAGTLFLMLAAGAFLQKQDKMRAGADVLISFVLMGCLVGPYVWYQHDRLGVFCFVKSNGIFEVYQGNSKASDGYLDTALFEKMHPAANRSEFELYKRRGEVAYVVSKREMFLKEFDVSRFLITTGKRILYFFYIFRHHSELPEMTFWILLRYVGYAIPGIVLLLYPLLGTKKCSPTIILMYVYIVGFALPYIFVAVMYRYSFPISTLTSILLGGMANDLIIKLRARLPVQ